MSYQKRESGRSGTNQLKIGGSGAEHPEKILYFWNEKLEICNTFERFHLKSEFSEAKRMNYLLKLSPIFKRVIWRKCFNRRNIMLWKNIEIGVDIDPTV